MANGEKQIINVDVVSALNDTDFLFINQGSALKQIKKPNATLSNPNALTIKKGNTTLTYDGSGAVSIEIPEDTERIEKLSTDTVCTLSSNKLYVFPEMSSLTITLETATDTSIVNEYHVIFSSPSDAATTLTLPNTINLPSSFTIETGKVYELSILENNLTYVSWDYTPEVTA